jgi:hypothetical protein
MKSLHSSFSSFVSCATSGSRTRNLLNSSKYNPDLARESAISQQTIQPTLNLECNYVSSIIDVHYLREVGFLMGLLDCPKILVAQLMLADNAV